MGFYINFQKKLSSIFKAIVSKRDHFLSCFGKLFRSPLQGRMGVVFIPGVPVHGIRSFEIWNSLQFIQDIFGDILQYPVFDENNLVLF